MPSAILYFLISFKRYFPYVVLLFAVALHAQIATLPFELKKNGHIILEVQLNDHPEKLAFLLDTGASGELLSSNTAEKLGISLDDDQKINAIGVSGKNSLHVIHNQKLDLGKGIALRLRNLAVGNNSPDGLLGGSIFKKYVCHIDYNSQKINFYTDIDELDKSGFIEVPFTFNNRIPIPQLEMTFTLSNGETFTEQVFYDIGAGTSFIFNTPFATEHDILSKSKHIKTLTVDGGLTRAKVTHKKILLPSLEFGGHSLDSVVVRVTNSKKGLFSFEGYAGVIGSQLAKRFNTIVDYKNKKLYFKPNNRFN